jgi:DNA-directed RNA polymerase subunit L
MENGKESDKKLFIPDDITGQYIDIIRLRPKLGLAVESITLSVTLSITTGSQNGTCNLGNCYYRFTVNHELANREWAKKGIDSKNDKKDWDLLQAKRFTVPDSYDFSVESYETHIYSPEQLVKIGCKTIQYDLNTFKSAEFDFQKSENTLENCVDILLYNCDYTIGKLLEYYIFTTKFPATIKYISFLKNHPHDKHGVLRLQYGDVSPTKPILEELISNACEECKSYFNFGTSF